MTDVEFLAYCEAHCRTERALFSREQVLRIFALAGQRLNGHLLPEWIAVRPAIMDPLVQAASAAARMTG